VSAHPTNGRACSDPPALDPQHPRAVDDRRSRRDDCRCQGNRFIFVASLARRRDLPAPRESIIPPRGLTAAWAAESLKGMPDRPETGRFHPGWRISLTQERRAQ
jgi:hypothetical protein